VKKRAQNPEAKGKKGNKKGKKRKAKKEKRNGWKSRQPHHGKYNLLQITRYYP
jgi:hypothetical protein